MRSENETVAEVVKWVRRECSSFPLPTAATEKLKLAREFQAAHNREIAAKDDERLTIVANYENVIAAAERCIEDIESVMSDGVIADCAEGMKVNDIIRAWREKRGAK